MDNYLFHLVVKRTTQKCVRVNFGLFYINCKQNVNKCSKNINNNQFKIDFILNSKKTFCNILVLFKYNLLVNFIFIINSQL